MVCDDPYDQLGREPDAFFPRFLTQRQVSRPDERVPKRLALIQFLDPSNPLAVVPGPRDLPMATVVMPSLEKITYFQSWPSTTGNVTYGECNGIKYSLDGEHMMGVIQVSEAGTTLTQATYNAYRRIIDLVGSRGYKLVRGWNFVPRFGQIDPSSGQQRYKAFCEGRTNACRDSRLEEKDIFAATGIGPYMGPMSIMFLAARGYSRVTNLENPNQVPSYRYEKEYGSPHFARATWEEWANGRYNLYISGTASIERSKTVHVGDVRAQTEKTLGNIATLISRVNLLQHQIEDPPDLTLADINSVTIYVADARDISIVEPICREKFPRSQLVYVIAEVCRTELAVEIEGIVTGRRRPRR